MRLSGIIQPPFEKAVNLFIGPFGGTVCGPALDEFCVHVCNLSVDTDDKGGYQHPHVSSEGSICWGDYETEARTYHRAGDFLALKEPDREPTPHLQFAQPLHQPRRMGERRRDGLLRVRRALFGRRPGMGRGRGRVALRKLPLILPALRALCCLSPLQRRARGLRILRRGLHARMRLVRR